MEDKCLLLARQLSVGYGNRLVAEKISFSVGPGEILILLGPNGCGKSTLLKTLSGELPALSGELLLEGRPIGEYTAGQLAEKRSLVTTGRIVNARMTVRELVRMGRFPYMNYLMKERETDTRAIDHAMELTGTSRLKDSFVETLSDGQLQRVMIARALCQDTPLILLDEPASYLDLHYTVELMKLLKDAAGEGKGLVIALHDTRQAQALADRLLCFVNGEVKLLEEPDRLSEEMIREMYRLSTTEYDFLWKK